MRNEALLHDEVPSKHALGMRFHDFIPQMPCQACFCADWLLRKKYTFLKNLTILNKITNYFLFIFIKNETLMELFHENK